MTDHSSFMREGNYGGERVIRDFTKKSGNSSPWGTISYPEGAVLDLISTRNGRTKPSADMPLSPTMEGRLEKTKREVAQCTGEFQGVPKEQRAEIMKHLKRKIAKKHNRDRRL